MPSDITLSHPVFLQHVFAYQKTKRLGLLLEQLSWSLNLDQTHPKKQTDLHIHLQAMVEEARLHVLALAEGLKDRPAA